MYIFKFMVVLWRVNVPPIQSSSTKITNQSWKLIIKSCTVDVFNLIKLKTLPSSSETSKISSTVSGKLIRCFSVVICEEQDKDARERYGGDRGRSGMEKKENIWRIQVRSWTWSRQDNHLIGRLSHSMSRLLLLRIGVTMWTMHDVLLTAETDSSVTSFSTSMTEM